MGIGYQASLMICEYYEENNILPKDAKSIMLGRQDMAPISQSQKNAIQSSYPKIEIDSLSGYAENFFENIGFNVVDSLDLTHFEGASKLFNLSIPLSTQNASSLKEKYDAVFDFGTSEHVFSISTSIKNSLFMLKKN